MKDDRIPYRIGSSVFLKGSFYNMANEMMNRRHDDMFDAMNDWFNFPRNFFDNDRVANIMQSLSLIHI